MKATVWILFHLQGELIATNQKEKAKHTGKVQTFIAAKLFSQQKRQTHC